jgi:outer membrane protein assembly factor BamB
MTSTEQGFLMRATQMLARCAAVTLLATLAACSGGGPATTVKGVTRRGSVEELNPATGATVWQTGLPNGVLTSPTLDGSGVLGVGTYDNGTAPNATYLLNASTGAILKSTGRGAVDFPQSVFANGWVFTANNLSLSAWGP